MIDEILQVLTNRSPLAPLCPTQAWQPEISQQILKASDSELFGSKATAETQYEMLLACRAGLLLLNDDLNASHNISQQIETPTGSFWHAIMHRREGDFSNANYWWLRTGEHPAFKDVYNQVMNMMPNHREAPAQEFSRLLTKDAVWKPLEFVELCKQATQEKTDASWLQSVQPVETTTFLNWCRERAG